jgi:UDP-N-acetylmuramate--alanine ligase
MTTVVLQHAGLNPSFVIGSELNESGSNAHHGTGPHFVVEADESDGTFLRLPTSVAIVTNVEADHLNYWADYQAIEDAFVQFVVAAPFAVICHDDPGARTVAQRARSVGAHVVTYGVEPGADARLRITPGPTATAEFVVDTAHGTVGPVSLRVPGRHNALNATAAALACLELGCTPAQVAAGLSAFTGTHRRFEYRGQEGGVRVFDDYAHHPTEIEAVLRAARDVVGDGRVIVAFQAHHYYRTAMFSREFGQALGLADFAVVLEVFAPGETPIPGASGSTMAANVPLPSGCVVFEPSWSAVPGHLVAAAQPGDIIMTLGAGDIGMMCPTILELLRN